MIKPEQADGMILARGGSSQGYALWLKEGRPAFTVVAGGKATTVAARDPIRDWSTVVGVITAKRQLRLQVNGQWVAEAPLTQLIPADPNDSMQIGADLANLVVSPAPPKFKGLIERVRVFSGEGAERP